ncbi:hypothetical protein KS4_20330 [Poriferisphaera corsica]|uniref:Uncharacterized protein n=1 Tax=Poriferisphaera corsica TaxID=2528020 RepID=A0A517YUP1_9BACT|nr:hypothetical protein [Poriferisphaera corsica]QDU33973.1 hypothetical protein KS4_20330 [Poriferisphaera corsica]
MSDEINMIEQPEETFDNKKESLIILLIVSLVLSVMFIYSKTNVAEADDSKMDNVSKVEEYLKQNKKDAKLQDSAKYTVTNKVLKVIDYNQVSSQIAIDDDNSKPFTLAQDDSNPDILIDQSKDEIISEFKQWRRMNIIQSIAGGGKPTVVINGTIYRIGDQIDDFAIIKIETSSNKIVVKKKQYAFVVYMK